MTFLEKLLESLRNEWCTCVQDGKEDEGIWFFENHECSCGIDKHHYHCEDCGGVTQIG